jgi:hypothetical protein
VWVDAESAWSVTPNPLGGSSSSQRWYSNQALTGTASSTTLVFVFYRQVLQTLSYSVSRGGSGYSPPTFQANQFGSAFPITLTTTAAGYWFDYGSPWTVDPNPLTGSTSNERWLTTQAVSGSIVGSATRAFMYQHEFYLTMQVNPSGAGSVSRSSGWYNAGQALTIEATASTGYGFLSWTGSGAVSYTGASVHATITMNSAITETANFGVKITITSNPIGSGYVSVDGIAVTAPHTYVWVIGDTHTIAAASTVSCGTGCQYVFIAWSDGGDQSHTITVPGAPTTYTATFQKQTLQTLSYSVSGGGSGYSPPTFQAKQLGSPATVTLTNTATGYWFDFGSSWTVAPNPLDGSTSDERWFTTQATTGSITGSATRAFTYQHQYYLTMQVSPSGAGSVSPGGRWYEAGQKVTIVASAKAGYKFLEWTGSGTGSYSGTSPSTTITIDTAITEVADFEVVITITSSPAGAGYVTVDGVAVRTPVTFVWVIGDTHTIAASSSVSCGTGCQYFYTAWSDGDDQSHTITVPDSPTTYTATFQRQYLLTTTANPSAAGSAAPSSGWYDAGQKITLTATPNTGYTFKSWKGTGSGSYTGTNPSPTITMNSPITETANFS